MVQPLLESAHSMGDGGGKVQYITIRAQMGFRLEKNLSFHCIEIRCNFSEKTESESKAQE